MLEELGENHLAPPMSEPIGMERNKRAAHDHEQAKAHPGADQWQQATPGELAATALHVGEGIDDPAEQDGFGELSASKRDIGEGKQPAEPDLGTKQAKHPGIEADEGHAGMASEQPRRAF